MPGLTPREPVASPIRNQVEPGRWWCPESRPSIRRSAGDAPNQSRLAQSLSSTAETVSNTLRYEPAARVLVLKHYSTWAGDGEQVAIPLGCGGVRRHGATQAMIVNELLEVSDHSLWHPTAAAESRWWWWEKGHWCRSSVSTTDQPSFTNATLSTSLCRRSVRRRRSTPVNGPGDARRSPSRRSRTMCTSRESS